MTPPTIETLLATPVLSGLAFSADGGALFASSNASGVFRAVELDLSEGGVSPRSGDLPDSVYVVAAWSEGRGFLVTKDSGGDELAHLFLSLPGEPLKELTPWPGVRVEPLGWCRERTRFAFLANRRDKAKLDLWFLDRETLECELAFENDTGFLAGTVSPNGELLALRRPASFRDSDVFVCTLATGEVQLLTEHEGEIDHTPVRFTPDSQALLVGCDRDSEFSDLWHFPLDGGVAELLVQAGGTLMAALFSPCGQYRLTLIDKDAALQLTVTRGDKTLELPSLPQGQITATSFAPDSSRLAVLVETPQQAPTPYIFDLEALTLEGPLPTVAPELLPEQMVPGSHVRFESYDGLSVPGVLYPAAGRKPGERGPGLVYVHGGPGGQSRLSYRPMQQYLALHGYEVFAVNNRGSAGYGKTFFGMDSRAHGDADLDDCVAAKQLLIDGGRVDPERIAIVGGSYGGFMVLAAQAFRPGEFPVGVDIFGVSNWLRTLKEYPPWWESFIKIMWQDIGHPVEDEEYLRSISPLFHAEKIRAPLMVLQGANDPRVLQAESDEIVAAVRANEVPVEYLVFEDEGHGFVKKENQARGYRGVREFLDQYL